MNPLETLLWLNHTANPRPRERGGERTRDSQHKISCQTFMSQTQIFGIRLFSNIWQEIGARHLDSLKSERANTPILTMSITGKANQLRKEKRHESNQFMLNEKNAKAHLSKMEQMKPPKHARLDDPILWLPSSVSNKQIYETKITTAKQN